MASYEQLDRWLAMDYDYTTTANNGNTANTTNAAGIADQNDNRNTANGTANGTAHLQGRGPGLVSVDVSLKVSVEVAAVLGYRPMCEQYHADRHYR